MEQKAFSFDWITVKKIFKGALLAATGAGAIAFLSYIGSIKIDNPELASLVAFGVPFLINIVREYIKGNLPK